MTSALRDNQMNISDEDREERIVQALHASQTATDRSEAQRQWEIAVGLINGRSEEVIQDMERARGLR